MEFNATYDFIDRTPHVTSSRALGGMKGSFGVELKGLSRAEKFQNLPSYSRYPVSKFPRWKQKFINKNRKFNEVYGHLFDDVLAEIRELGVSSWQKLEWNLKGEDRNIFNYIIQFRGSGIRLKRKDYFPSLVTVSTQIPILGWERRYISKHEGAKLQSLNGIELPAHNSSAFSALGNAVNARIVQLIAIQLFQHNDHMDYLKTNHLQTLFA